jgi:hypothetical protein
VGPNRRRQPTALDRGGIQEQARKKPALCGPAGRERERERESALTLSKAGREHAAAADASRWRKMRSEPRAEVPAIRGARSREGGRTVGAGGV